MKHLFRPAVLAVPLLLTAAAAWAAGEAGPASPWYDFWSKAVNLGVLVALIWYFARKPVGAALRTMAAHQKETVDHRRAEAERSGREMALQKQQILDLQGELERMLTEAREDGERERTRLTAEAREWAEHLKAQTQVQVEQEVRKARQELRAELADLTVRLAEQKLRGSLTPEHQKRLVSSFISQLEARQ